MITKKQIMNKLVSAREDIYTAEDIRDVVINLFNKNNSSDFQIWEGAKAYYTDEEVEMFLQEIENIVYDRAVDRSEAEEVQRLKLMGHMTRY